jgi:glucosamine-6-phosphate deaminase
MALKYNNQKICYPPAEKVKTIIVENFPALGKLSALRFIEWAQKNQSWTISLPTGKTPEYFIKWVYFLLDNGYSGSRTAWRNLLDPAQSLICKVSFYSNR